MKPSLESVEWLDACLHADTAGPGKAALMSVTTVGWVIYADKQKLEIAAERYEDGTDTTWRGVTVIPRGWVKKRRRLK